MQKQTQGKPARKQNENVDPSFLMPLSSELIPDNEFKKMIATFRLQPGMVLLKGDYNSVVNYILAYDQALWSAPLLGLHQWLVVKTNGGNNMHWSYMIEMMHPHLKDCMPKIEALCDTITEFLAYRRKNGLTKIFYDYGRWLLRRSYYDGPLRRKNDMIKLDENSSPW